MGSFCEKHGHMKYACSSCVAEPLDQRIAELEAQLAALKKAARASMKGCTRCWGKVKYSGKDFEPCVCSYCEALKAALIQESE